MQSYWSKETISLQFLKSYPRNHFRKHTEKDNSLNFLYLVHIKTMAHAQPNLAELINLPLPLQMDDLLRWRQFIRRELNEKIQQLRQVVNKPIYYIKCPCDLEMCDHMDPLTADLHLSWCPLESELAHFFMQQPWAHLGIYVYPHCIECNDSTLCGASSFAGW